MIDHALAEREVRAAMDAISAHYRLVLPMERPRLRVEHRPQARTSSWSTPNRVVIQKINDLHVYEEAAHALHNLVTPYTSRYKGIFDAIRDEAVGYLGRAVVGAVKETQNVTTSIQHYKNILKGFEILKEIGEPLPETEQEMKSVQKELRVYKAVQRLVLGFGVPDTEDLQWERISQIGRGARINNIDLSDVVHMAGYEIGGLIHGATSTLPDVAMGAARKLWLYPRDKSYEALSAAVAPLFSKQEAA